MLCLAEFNWDALFAMPNLPIVAVFGTMLVVGTAGVIAGAWMKSKQYRYEAHLKRDLVARGYSADEIERIVSASFSDKKDKT